MRWATRPDIGFPSNGYRVTRLINGQVDAELPGSPFVLPPSGSWSQLAQEAQVRRPPAGPYFPTIEQENLDYLLPLIALADLTTDPTAWPFLAEEVADFFGSPHEDDAVLGMAYWLPGAPPSLAQLLADPNAGQDVIRFYRDSATGFLLSLATRFEYAVLLGLATDDEVTTSGDVQYVLHAEFGGDLDLEANATSDRTMTNRLCDPRAPDELILSRYPGSVPHPAFEHIVGWNPPAELMPQDPAGEPLPIEVLVPKAPAAFTALEWSPPNETGQLIDHEPVLYELTRFGHGASTAGLDTAPAVPGTAVFEEIVPGELLMRPDTTPHFLDLPGMPWPDLEGYYTYRIRGVDLLGARSSKFTEATLRHADDIPPSSPRLRYSGEQTLEFGADSPPLTLDLQVDWGAAEDFAGPDVAEFRVAARWRPRMVESVTVDSVSDVDALHADLQLAQLDVPPASYDGTQLVLPNGTFLIESYTPGTPASMRVFKSDGTLPEPSDGAIFAAGVPTAPVRAARMARAPVVAAKVNTTNDVAPIDIELTPVDGQSLPTGEHARIYLHLLRSEFEAERMAAATWRLAEPPPDVPRLEALLLWRSLPDPATALQQSPALIFAHHEITVTVTPPADFVAGVLQLEGVAADDASYRDSPNIPGTDQTLENLTGNEGAPGLTAISVRSTDPPDQPAVAPWDPQRIIWAESAADYSEHAAYRLMWSETAGAARYEVWRAHEGALQPPDATLSDEDLRISAAAQPGAFGLRSDHVFSSSHHDKIPGRSPTRVLYRVRAVNLAGVPGAWSEVIGPVHVPDVHPPSAPTLLRLGPPSETSTRTVRIEWSQTGPLHGLRFEVERRRPDEPRWSLVQAVPASAATSPGRWAVLHEDVAPGSPHLYRVVAIREALDPIDPFGASTRPIASIPSSEKTGLAAGELRPPEDLSATVDVTTGSVTLTWSNRDDYTEVEIRRRGAQRFGFARLGRVSRDSEVFVDESVPSGTYTYAVRGLGGSRRADAAATAEVDVS